MMVPVAPNDRWSLDIVSDQLTDGRRFRILTVRRISANKKTARLSVAFGFALLLDDPKIIQGSSGGQQFAYPAWLLASSRPCLGGVVWVSELRFDLGVGPTLRNFSRRPTEPAAKLI